MFTVLPRYLNMLNRILALFAGVFVLFTCQLSYTQTSVSGVISSDETWTLANSPYLLSGNILVSSNVTLTIEPGVRIQLDNDTFIKVDGTLVAVGTDAKKITFDPFGRGIHFDDSAVDYNPSDDSGNRIKHAIIKNPTSGSFDPVMSGGHSSSHLVNTHEYNSGASNNQVSILLSNSHLEDVNIVFNGWGGSNVNETTIVENNVFVRGEISADNESNTILRKNIFHEVAFSITSCHMEYNIFNDCTISRFYPQSYGAGTKYVIKNNYINTNISKFQQGTYIDFINNTYKISAGDHIVGHVGNVTGNNLLGGSQYKYRLSTRLDDFSVSVVSAENNYWGTTIESEIQSAIYDQTDDFQLDEVDYTPFLTSLNTTAPISPPSDVTKTTSGSGVLLNWSANAESDVAGYRLHYGTPTGYSYATSIDLGNVTSYTVAGGDISTEYAITAYDSDADQTDDQVEGHESFFSVAKATFSISSSAEVSFKENEKGLVYTITTTGSSSTAISYSLGNKHDEDYFDVNENTGEVSLKSERNFEYPDDADRNNVYKIEVRANDGSIETNREVNISITDENDAPFQVSKPVGRYVQGEEIFSPLQFADPDKDEVSISPINIPSWVALNQIPGSLKTYVGSGNEGRDDRIGGNASFSIPQYIATTNDGWFVSEPEKHRIRKVSTQGEVTTYTGAGQKGFENGSINFASFNHPMGLDVDYEGSLYVADRDNHVIRKVSATGVVTTFAGTGTPGATNGVGTNASFNSPVNVAVDNKLNVYVADAGNNVIRKISKDGVVTTLAGSGTAGFTNGNGSSASFNNPVALGFHRPTETLYVVDQSNHAIRKIDMVGNVTTVIGNGSAGSDDGLNGTLSSPTEILFDRRDDLYIVETGANRIRKHILRTGITTTLLETNQGFVDGEWSQAKINGPIGLASTLSGFYLVDSKNHTIREVILPMYALEGTAPQSTGQFRAEFRAEDGRGGELDENLTYTIYRSTASAPSFGSTNEVFYEENKEGTVHQAIAHYPLTSFTYSLGNSNDNNLFTIDGTNGEILFKSSPDFESPEDLNGDNKYEINIVASGGGQQISQLVTITVTDVDEDAPVFTSPANINFVENSTADAYKAKATDDNPISYAITGGADANFFKIGEITGVVTFLSIPTVANPQDKNNDNVYEIEIRASDNFNFTKQTIFITVVDQSASQLPFFTSTPLVQINDNEYYSYQIQTSDDQNLNVSATVLPDWLKIIRENQGEVSTIAGSTYGSSRDGSVETVTFTALTNVAEDSKGNIYVAESFGHQIRKISLHGEVTTFAGVGHAGYRDGAGREAKLNWPIAIVIDNEDNVFVADSENHRIRKITPDGVVSTFAGIGVPGFDDGDKDVATLNLPYAMAFDNAGNLLVSEHGNHAIRRIASNGSISTVAGSGNSGSVEGVGKAASFNRPQGLAVDNGGNVYVVDSGNNKIRKIESDGTVTTLAGSGTIGSQDGNGASASFNGPTEIVLDRQSLFVADFSNHLIREISLTGDVTTFSGTGNGEAKDGDLNEAAFNYPYGISKDYTGNLLVSEYGSGRVRKIANGGFFLQGSPEGKSGNYEVQLLTEDGSGNSACQTFTILVNRVELRVKSILRANSTTQKIHNPDARFRVTFNKRIQNLGTDDIGFNPSGVQGRVSGLVKIDDQTFDITLNGVSEGLVDLDFLNSSDITDMSGNPLENLLPIMPEENFIIENQAPKIESSPVLMVNEDEQYLYRLKVSDPDGDPLNFRGINLPDWLSTSGDSPGYFTQFAGSGSSGFLNGLKDQASFNQPMDVKADQSGNLFIVDFNNHAIRKIAPDGQVTTFAGSGTAGNADGQGTAASFNSPVFIDLDGDGNIIVPDLSNNIIRKITPDGLVTTIAGSGSASSVDGNGLAVSFHFPYGIAIASDGTIYISETGSHSIRKIANDGTVTTLAGSGSPGYVDGTGSAASFSRPTGLALDADDNLYVADEGNYRIRRVTPAGVVTTFAGSGAQGRVNGSANNASFTSVAGLHFGSNGVLYVADRSNNLVRQIDSSGQVSDFAGTGAGGLSLSAKNPLEARVVSPHGITQDPHGNFFITQVTQGRIAKVSAGEFELSGDPAGKTGDHEITLEVFDNFYSVANEEFTNTRQSYTLTVKDVFAPRITNIKRFSPLTENTNCALLTFRVEFSEKVRNVGLGDFLVRVNGISDRIMAVTERVEGLTYDVDVALTSDIGLVKLEIQGGTDIEDLGGNRLSNHTPTGVYETYNLINSDPIFSSQPPIALGLNMDYQYDIEVTDPDPNELEVSSLQLPSWLTLEQKVQVTTVAGNGSGTFKDGSAAEAAFQQAQDAVMDSKGNIFVADALARVIRKITPDGIVSTFAGSQGQVGSKDDFGRAATFSFPYALAIDDKDNLYVADNGYYSGSSKYAATIRLITPEGQVMSYAGGKGEAAIVDGFGLHAKFFNPLDIAVDKEGNVYVTDVDNSKSDGLHVIRKITPNFDVITIAGSTRGYIDGVGAEAKFSNPIGLTVDICGNIFVADYDNHRIRKVTKDGVVTSFSGNGIAGFKNGSALESKFSGPLDLAFGYDGNLYVSEQGNAAIRKVGSDGSVRTFAGTGDIDYADGEALSAKFNYPTGIFYTSGGELIIADNGNFRIRKITSSVTLKGNSGGTEGDHLVKLQVSDGKGGLAEQSFTIHVDASSPEVISIERLEPLSENAHAAMVSFKVTLSEDGVNIDPNDFIIESGGANGIVSSVEKLEAKGEYKVKISQINTTGVLNLSLSESQDIKDLAGNVLVDITPQNEEAFSIVNSNPRFTSNPDIDISVNKDYCYAITTEDSDSDLASITGIEIPSWLFLSPVNSVEVFAGSIQGDLSGKRLQAQFDGPRGMAYDSKGNLYISEINNHKIKKIDVNGLVTDFAGSVVGDEIGTLETVKFNGPYGLTFDKDDNLYVADYFNHKIKKISPSGEVTLVAGSGTQGYLDGNAAEAQFYRPSKVQFDSKGNLFIMDAFNFRIRKLASDGTVSTFAGSGENGDLDGIGIGAKIGLSYDFIIDAEDNILLADHGADKIKKITPNAEVTTIVGSEEGDLDGVGTGAKLAGPSSIIADEFGNLYIVERRGSLKIKKISPSFEVTTLAGKRPEELNGEPSLFLDPRGIVMGPQGMLYISDSRYDNIKRLNLYPVLKGNPGNESGKFQVKLEAKDGFGGSAIQDFEITVTDQIAPQFLNITRHQPRDENVRTSKVTFLVEFSERLKNIERADFNLTGDVTGIVNRVEAPAGDGYYLVEVINLKGSGLLGLELKSGKDIVDFGDNVLANLLPEGKNEKYNISENTAPKFSTEPIISVDEGKDYLYSVRATDENGDAITFTAPVLPSWLRVNSPGVSTFLNNATGYQDGPIETAQIDGPGHIAFDSFNNMYITDNGNKRIRKITPGGVVSTFAGSGQQGSVDGKASEAQFSSISGIAVDAHDNVYVTDRTRIRKITQAGDVSTLAGSATSGFVDGKGAEAQFNGLYALTIDKEGNIYAAENASQQTIRKITPDGVVTTLAGSSASGSQDGQGTEASFNSIWDLVIGQDGNIYVADAFNHLIRKVTPSGQVTTLAGIQGGGYSEGSGNQASFNFPIGLDVDANGNLLVADWGNNRIRKVTTDGLVSTLVGSQSGTQDGPIDQALFVNPAVVEVDRTGNVFVIPYLTSRIRKVAFDFSITGNSKDQLGLHDVVLLADDGLGGTTEQAFTITVNDISIPKIIAFNPQNGTNNVPVGNNLEFTFDESIQAGTGKITLNDSQTGTELMAVDVTGSEVTVSDKTVTINPNVDLPEKREIFVKIPNTAFTDGTNNFPGIDNKETWNFRTVDLTAPVVQIISPTSPLVFKNEFKVNFIFDEPVVGFDIADITAKNAELSDFKGSGKAFSVMASAREDGELTLQIKEGMLTDESGNQNEDSEIFKRVVEATNVAPAENTLSNNELAENLPPGTFIGEFTATDSDFEDQHSFKLVQGEGSTDNAAFRIIGNKLFAKATFDFETKNSLSIRVRTTDARGMSRDDIKTIVVLNQAEPAMSIFLPRPDDPTDGTRHLAFQGTRIGQTRTRTIELSNTGSDGNVEISKIEAPEGFTVDQSELSIPEGEKKTVTVTFTPVDEKVYAGQLTITSNAGQRKIDTGGRGVRNRKPIAVSPQRPVFMRRDRLIRLWGFDPDGDEIKYEIVESPANGTLTAGAQPGTYTFTANNLTPGTVYEDAIKFKVVETESGLESDVGTHRFKFRVRDTQHTITNLEVISEDASALGLTLNFEDAVVNESYDFKLEYYDLSDITNAQYITAVSSNHKKENLTFTDGSTSLNFEIQSVDHPYVFSAEQVFVVVELVSDNGFSDSKAYIISNQGTGAEVLNTEGSSSSDGQFFVFAAQTSVPENESVEINLFAVEFGAFSLSDASISITEEVSNGSLTSPVEVKKSDNLAQWTVTYSSDTEIGLLDDFEFTVNHPGRDGSAVGNAEIEVVGINDSPTLETIDDQQTDEETALQVALEVADPDNELIITATSSDDDVSVEVNGSTLNITPGAEFNGTSTITVTVTEQGTEDLFSEIEQFELTVNPVNDKPVVTTIGNQAVDEDNELVLLLSATDVDADVPLFDFAANSDNDQVTFALDGSTLTITPSENFNGQVEFSITADDGLGTTNSVSEAEVFTLTVNPVNDAPEVSTSIPSQSLVEGFPAYTLDLSQYFNDLETASSDLTYTTTSLSNVALNVSGSNLTITAVDGVIGLETATVTASDGELSVSQEVAFITAEASGQVSVANPITDLVLNEDFGSRSIDLSNVFSYSADASATFTYVISGNNNIEASMNGQTLELTSQDNFNGDDTIFIIGSTDGQSSFTSFDIQVDPVNDAPELVIPISDETVAEDDTFTKVISGDAFNDVDGDQLTYSADFEANWLSFDASTRTFSGTPLNNDVGTINVTVTAVDGSGAEASDSFDLEITNTNDDPTDIAITSDDIDENSIIGTVVGVLSSTDQDVGDNTFTYALVAGAGDTDNAKFEIVEGELKTKEIVNFEAQSSYSVRIQTTDGFEGAFAEAFTISVNNLNEAVTSISLDNLSLNENTTKGTAIGALTSTDEDGTDTFSFELTEGEGDDDNALFAIVDSNLTANWVFDFETESTYNIRLKSTDAGGLSFEETFTITINDVNEVPTAFSLLTATLAENAANGLTIGGFEVTDPDANDTHSFELVAGEGDTDNSLFKISGNKLASNAEFDFEQKNQYSVRIKSTDVGGLSVENSFTISITDVNEAATDIELDDLSIPENQSAGTLVGNLTAIDPDGNDTHTFALVSGQGDSDNGSFDINGTTLVSKEEFDFETKNEYLIRLQTMDREGLTFEKSLVIIIENQAEPIIETSSANLSFGTVEVGETSQLSFEIQNSGDGTLVIQSIELPATYSADWTSGEIAPSSSQVVNVTFEPADAEVYAGQIVITSNGGEQVIEVTGEGEIVTGIDLPTLSPDLLRTYPNPTSDLVTIDLTLLRMSTPEMGIYDVNGIRVFRKVKIREETVTVDVSSYTQGIYLIRLIGDKGIVTKRLIIKR